MRLQGLAWRQDAEMRLAHVRARNATAKAGHRGMVTVIRMPVRDWHAERFGSRAGWKKHGLPGLVNVWRSPTGKRRRHRVREGLIKAR